MTEDADPGTSQLINSFGYASQEVVNLMITGEVYNIYLELTIL